MKVITIGQLENLRACDSSLRFLAPILPITIADTESENIETAMKIVKHYTENKCVCTACIMDKDLAVFRSMFDDVDWLLDSLRSQYSSQSLSGFSRGDLEGHSKLHDNVKFVLKVMEAVNNGR